MSDQILELILFRHSHLSGDDGTPNLTLVGRKVLGLTALPKAWCPPYMVLSAKTFDMWRTSDVNARHTLLVNVSDTLNELVNKWQEEWPYGLILRSSAVSESLRDRGTFDSKKLLPDFNSSAIRRSLEMIYARAKEIGTEEGLAIVLQPLVKNLQAGHISNERRVSSTVNRWIWEIVEPPFSTGGFNSQRSRPPSKTHGLVVRKPKDLIRVLRSVGRWCTELREGRANLEWSWDGNQLWLHQLDFEDDCVDEGVDPRSLIRNIVPAALQRLPQNSALKEVQFENLPLGWKKIDLVNDFIHVREQPYPNLYYLNGEVLLNEQSQGRSVATLINYVTQGRAVCRTDFCNSTIRMTNLPRTDSVSAGQAVAFMHETIKSLNAAGVDARQICFIIHQFIPSIASAWSAAAPENQLVLIDSIWGVPDGLQYLPHDSFEYDIKREKVSAERKRYKPVFVQETSDGRWQETRILNRLARYRSLSMPDIREIAALTHQMAVHNSEPVRVMWFCKIPQEVGVGRNLPWYKMSAPIPNPNRENSLGPARRRLIVRNVADVEEIANEINRKSIIELKPEVKLIRDDDRFLDKIIAVAKENKVPVELHGSALGHAYYTLSRAGVTTVLADVSSRSRVRGRRVFQKIVRDDIPSKIERRGEEVTLARIEQSESRGALLAKLLEEALEARAAESPEDLTVELADILEVVRALSTTTGLSWDNVLRVADEKRAARGSFEHGVVLLETTWPSSTASKGKETRKLPLLALAEINYLPHGMVVPFSALFAKGFDPIIKFDSGVRLRLALTASGISIEELQEEIVNVDQLAFDY